MLDFMNNIHHGVFKPTSADGIIVGEPSMVEIEIFFPTPYPFPSVPDNLLCDDELIPPNSVI